MQDQKMDDRRKCRAGKCGTGKWRTISQGWKMQDWKMKDHIDEKGNAEDKNGSTNAFERRSIINFVHIVNTAQAFATNKCM